MFEDKFYANLDARWTTLSEDQKSEILEQARYDTYTTSKWGNLLPVFYITLGIPALLGVFVVLPYLYIWESIFVVPIGMLIANPVGLALHARIHAKLIAPAVSRILRESGTTSP
jgi:hypothetical protein